jgi:N-acetylmuramoyl-L-alanine amidase
MSLRRLAALALIALFALPAPSMAADGPRPMPARPYVVVIDPGHGGSNEGCTAFDGHVREKAVTLWLATALAAAVARRIPHAKVVVTRDGDEPLGLAERVALANRERADLFVSIHANASTAHDQHGFETYVLEAERTGLDAAMTARRASDEGFADAFAARDGAAAAMLRELALVAGRTSAARLATDIQRGQAARFPARADRGVRQGSFDVLLGARMPAVLFEAGFLDHAQEGRLLVDPIGRALVVDGLAEAIAADYRRRLRTAIVSPAQRGANAS